MDALLWRVLYVSCEYLWLCSLLPLQDYTLHFGHHCWSTRSRPLQYIIISYVILRLHVCHELIGTGKSLKAASMCHFGDHQALCCSWQKINSLIFSRIVLYHITSHHIVSFCIASPLIVLFRIAFCYNVSCCIAMYYTVSLWGICRLCFFCCISFILM